MRHNEKNCCIAHQVKCIDANIDNLHYELINKDK